MRRREFFSSLTSSFSKKKQEKIIRPPYYNDKNLFHKECPSCEGLCSTFCEEEIIIISKDKTPYLDFSKGGCTYCNKCAEVCDKDVLKLELKKQINIKIEIDILKCLSWNETMCFSCKDYCLDNAIEFLAMFKPTIFDDKCTKCGFCINICPTNAISLEKGE